MNHPYSYCPFLHPLDKFVELFKPNIVILMATPHCFDLNFCGTMGVHQCVQNTTTTYAMFVTKDFSTMILFTIASLSEVLIHNSFIFFGLWLCHKHTTSMALLSSHCFSDSSGNHNSDNKNNNKMICEKGKRV